MNAYSPFEKSLAELEAADLAVLKNVAEGWYVEYKREVPNPSSIAKSISAFANTYGGWLFYGVQEQAKEQPVAGTFPGIAKAAVDGALQRLRQAVAEYVTPIPHFDSKTLWGPSEAIGLGGDQAVICTHIPWSPNTPHVHKDARIYRRVADSSEPKAENDRFLLDQLWRRGDKVRQKYADWINTDPELSDAEAESPFLRLLLVADLWEDRNPWTDMSLDEVRAEMRSSSGIVSSVPFDLVHTSPRGFTARQISGNDPSSLSLTWLFRRSLISEVLVPFKFVSSNDPEDLEHLLHGYAGAARFARILKTKGYKRTRIIDMNFLFGVLIGIVETQRRLFAKAGWKDRYFVKARLLNVWRICPFVDVTNVLDEYEKHGVPMCLNRVITCPSGTDPESFFDVSQFEDMDTEYARIVTQALHIFMPIALSLGVPPWIAPEPGVDNPPYYEDLMAAGQRALEVQRRRNEAS